MKDQIIKLINLARKFGEVSGGGEFKAELSEIGVGYYDVIPNEVFNITFKDVIVMFGMSERLMIMNPLEFNEQYLQRLIDEYQVKCDSFTASVSVLIEKRDKQRADYLKRELDSIFQAA